jgi:hypothetical protein
VRIHGGSGHRIVRNHFTAQAMDSIFVDAAVREIAGNLMDSNPGLSDKSDECIYIADQGDQDLWVIGNICIDQEFSGVVSEGNNQGVLYVVNNTFVRNGLTSLAAVRRNGDMRQVVMRNNAYLGNTLGVAPGDGGDGFDIDSDASDDTHCSDCGAATVANLVEVGDLGVVNAAGTDAADFRPRAGSPLVDSGVDLVDRNGKTARRFNDAAPERGALER